MARNATATKPVVAPPKQATELAVIPSKASVLAIISNAASSPDCNPEKMRTLLDMFNEVKADEARREFTQAKIALQRVLPTIDKDGKIVVEPKPNKRGYSTPFASFENIMATCKPLLLEHGFDLWFAPDIGEGNRLIMRGHLDHLCGHSKTCAIPMPLENGGGKNDAQGVGSSITYAKRYATIALLNIVSRAKQDVDIDGNNPEDVAPPAKLSPDQVKKLAAAIEFCGVGVPKFCSHYGIDKVENLSVDRFDEALKACKDFKEKAAANAKN